MILAHANLGRGVSAAEFRRNARMVLNAGGARAVFAFQEIDEADAPEEMDYLTDRLGKTHRIAGERTAVPIFVPNHFALLAESQALGCRGLAKFTPHRPINEAVIGIGPNLEPALFNFHVPLDRPETQGRRAQMRRNVRARANRHETGLWVADTNHRRGWPTIVPGEKTVTEAGIDKAKAWSADRRVEVTGRRTIPLSIDGHDGHVARVMWLPR